MAGEIFEGWEGVALRGAETTAGTVATTIALPFGYVKNVNPRESNNLEEEGAVGTPYTVSFEEGINDVGGSMEFLPAAIDSLLTAKRNGSNKLTSYSIHVAVGAGMNHLGAKVNQLRMSLDAGGRFRANLDWMALASVDAAALSPIIPTGEIMNWIKAVHNLPDIVANIEITIAQNLQRRAVLANGSTVFPVPAQKRAAYRLREGRQRTSLTTRFFERPSANALADCVTALSDFTLGLTGCVGTTPLAYIVTLTSGGGKPVMRELNASEGGEALWPYEARFKDWNVALAP